MRRGADGRRGLDALRDQARKRARELRKRGELDGTLQQVKQLLEDAVEAERRELFPDPSDAARMAEAELATLPDDTARAVRALSEYPWRSEEARADYEKIQDLLREEVLDAQFEGMKQAMAGARARGPRAGPRDDERPQRHARRRRPRRAHARGLRELHGRARRVLPGARRRTSRNWSTRWPGGRRRRRG